jgi:OOP family OmpA-OmpF porin
MTARRPRRTALAACAALLLLAACATTDPRPSAPATPPETPSPSASPVTAAPPPAPVLRSAPGPLAPVAPMRAAPQKPDYDNNVYFASASAQIDARGRATLQALAARLKADRESRISLIGHTDHLGSSEYNVALGQKRVEAVYRELLSLGVSSRQFITRSSYGSELVADDCRDETCRTLARRVELQILESERRP